MPTLSATIPWEILRAIFSKVRDAKTALTVMRVCKTTYDLLRPTKKRPLREFWKHLRERDGWPNPKTVGLTDYTFLLTVYGRGCSNCSFRPHLRSPLWELYGLRLCPECIEQLTYLETAMYSGSVGRIVLSYYLTRVNYGKEYRFLKREVDSLVPTVDDMLSRQYKLARERLGERRISDSDWSRVLDHIKEALRPVHHTRVLSICDFVDKVKRNKREKVRWKGVDETYTLPTLRPRKFKTRSGR